MRSFHATSVTLALLAALLAVVLAPAVAHSQDVVIYEVYSGGGEPGATFQNDFVVLFNAGTSAVDLSQWSLQVNFGGQTWQAVPLCGSIPHGRFFLVTLGSSGPFGDPVPPGDCQGNPNLPLTVGAVTLVSDPGTLPETCPLANPLLVDLVGEEGNTSFLTNEWGIDRHELCLLRDG